MCSHKFFLFRVKLINSDTNVLKIVALQTLSQLKICDAVLEEVVISFLENADSALKVAALEALVQLQVHNKRV